MVRHRHGASASHGPGNMKARPLPDSMPPQVGAGGGTPSPRNDNDESIRVTMPATTEMSEARTAPHKPMIAERCARERQRESMSRPRVSVPNGKAQDGGFSRLTGLIWFMP